VKTKLKISTNEKHYRRAMKDIEAL